ncbi:MAG: P-loop NTPase [Actinomycetota bacterium]|nr:P-loop NTPase [Actinomycetota bacterium]
MIVGVTSGKGGPGATVLAVHLSAELARRGRSTLLLDLDAWGGDVGAYLGPENLDPRRGLRPLLKLEHAPSPEAVRRESQPVGQLQVVLGLIRPEPDLLEGRIDRVIAAADRMADVVVADLGRTMPRSPASEALRVVDATVVVARADLQGALAAERAIASIATEVQLVASAVRRHDAADVLELSEALERPVTATFPLLKKPTCLTLTRRVRRCVSDLATVVPGLLETPDDRVPEGHAVFAR